MVAVSYGGTYFAMYTGICCCGCYIGGACGARSIGSYKEITGVTWHRCQNVRVVLV